MMRKTIRSFCCFGAEHKMQERKKERQKGRKKDRKEETKEERQKGTGEVKTG